jgi:hypothetical protein
MMHAWPYHKKVSAGDGLSGDTDDAVLNQPNCTKCNVKPMNKERYL